MMTKHVKWILIGLICLSSMDVFAAQKTLTTYTWDGNIGLAAQSGFLDMNDPQVFEDLQTGSNAATPGSTSFDPANKTIEIGRNTTSCAVVWYGGNSPLANCENGQCDFGNGFRAYFEFRALTTDTSQNSNDKGDGFTFAVISGVNNTISRRGGPPYANPNDSNKYNMGELLCYAGSGNTGPRPDGKGLIPPKFAIEFDTVGGWGNEGPMDDDGCSPGRADNSNLLNHIATIFWGADTPGNCSSRSYIGENYGRGNNYPSISYDDNIHSIPSTGTTSNPRNSSHNDPTTDGSRGYCQRSGGKVSVAGTIYNWLEDPQKHAVRIEVARATDPATTIENVTCGSGTYAYNIKAWVDCEPLSCCLNSSCSFTAPTPEVLSEFGNVLNPFVNNDYLPKINRTVCLAASLHIDFQKMIFGWTAASTGASQNVQFSNLKMYFIP